MPSGPRIRANNVYGTTSDNPLLAAAVSFTSLGLSLLPAVSAAHAVICLDPKRVFGEPEIVVVTSHLAMGTTATITRAQYGTTARDHPQGTAWAHVPIDEDYTEIVTSSTRPTNPYDGQTIYETDTGRWTSRLGSTWIPAPHNVPACRVFHSANVSVADNAVVILGTTAGATTVFNSERYDTDAMHSTVTNPGRITFNTAGLYTVSAHTVFDGTVADYVSVFVGLRLNTTTYIAFDARTPANDAGLVAVGANITTTYKFVVGDFVEVYVWQNNTANAARNLISTGNYSPEFSATWVGVG